MTWESTRELAVILAKKGKPPEEIITKLCEVADRFKDRASGYSKRVEALRKELKQLMKDSGRLVQVKVDMIQYYNNTVVIWYKSRPYFYAGGGIWKPVQDGMMDNRWPNSTQYGKMKVWIEIDPRDRIPVSDGVIKGFVNGMTCITLEPGSQRKACLNINDKVVLAKVMPTV